MIIPRKIERYIFCELFREEDRECIGKHIHFRPY
jgi:hypothetical protein